MRLLKVSDIERYFMKMYKMTAGGGASTFKK